MKKITATYAFSKAWHMFWQNPVKHLGVFLLVFVVILFVVVINGFINLYIRLAFFDGADDSWAFAKNYVPDLMDKDLSLSTLFGLLWVILVTEFLVQIIVYMGVLYIYGYALDIVRNRYESITKVFTRYIKFSTVLYYYLYSIVYSFASFLSLIPFIIATLVIPGEYTFIVSIIIWLLLNIYIAIRLSFVVLFLLDGYDFSEAISQSWKRTKHYVVDIFLLTVLGIVAAILGLLVLVVGIFAAMPVIYFARAIFYNEAIYEQQAQAEAQSPDEIIPPDLFQR